MSNNLDGLASTAQRIKSAIKEELDKSNSDFHSALNQDEPISFYGLAIDADQRNKYLIDPSDLLFWNDPTAYMDELDRWEGQKIVDRHVATKTYIKNTEQENQFDRLVKSIQRKRIAPFVGAGLSFPCGYPLWGQTLKSLASKLESISRSETNAMNEALKDIEQINTCIQQNNYLEAAQIIYDSHESIMKNHIFNTFDGANNKDLVGPITLLPKLTDGCIITTNFDRLIEKVFLDHGKSIEGHMHGIQSNNQFASKLIKGDRCILKLHGDFDSYETYIFSKNQYDMAYGEGTLDYTKPLAKVLRQIFISHSLLFLGCSLESDRTLKLFADVVNSNSFDIPEHFAFLPCPDNEGERYQKEEFLSQHKINPLWYKVNVLNDGCQDHSQLENILLFALDCASGRA